MKFNLSKLLIEIVFLCVANADMHRSSWKILRYLDISQQIPTDQSDLFKKLEEEKHDRAFYSERQTSKVMRNHLENNTSKTSSQAPSYASPKLSPTDSLTGVKCRATSVAKKYGKHRWFCKCQSFICAKKKRNVAWYNWCPLKSLFYIGE